MLQRHRHEKRQDDQRQADEQKDRSPRLPTLGERHTEHNQPDWHVHDQRGEHAEPGPLAARRGLRRVEEARQSEQSRANRGRHGDPEHNQLEFSLGLGRVALWNKRDRRGSVHIEVMTRSARGFKPGLTAVIDSAHLARYASHMPNAKALIISRRPLVESRMNLRLLPRLAIAAALLSVAAPARASDWPNFRGPDHNGISKETGWSVQWPKEGPRKLWEAKVGTGYASFAVAGGRAFTTGNRNDTDTLYCFDAASGRELWKHSYPAALWPKYNEGGTSATPTVDGAVVFQLGKQGQFFCLDAAKSTVLWEKNLASELGATINEWGFGSSPLVEGELVIVNVGSAGTALEKATGKVRWTSGKEPTGYSSMVPFSSDGTRCLAFFALKAMVIVEAATGKELARVPWETAYDTNCADPVVGGDTLFVTSYDRGGATMQFTGGKIKFGWKDWTMHNHINSSVLLGGHLFGINGQAGKTGDLRCVDFKTGEAKWVQPGIGIGALMAADGKLIVLSERGELIIAAATPEKLTALARAQVLGGKCWTTPVLAHGRIYCRNTRGDVVCVDTGAK